MTKKPPDKYKTLKISLKGILKDKTTQPKLFEVVTRTNKLVIHVYQFLRLWILKKYHKNNDIPKITTDVIKMAFKALVEDKAVKGPKPKGDNFELYTEFCDFYKKEYKSLGYKNKIDGKNLSQIIGYLCTDMLTNIENNIKCHFIEYIKRYVNGCFKDEHNKILEQIENRKERATKNKELRKELYELKMDIINDTTKCNEKYHDWLKENRNKIVPKEYDKTYYYDIAKNPQKYLKHMIMMNLKLEEQEKKMFQFLPLRTTIYEKYCPIDTKSIIEILIDETELDENKEKRYKIKNDYLKDIEGNKDELWRHFFNLDHKIFKQKKMIFDYRMSTDGFAVSLQFLMNNKVEESKLKKQKMKEGKNKDTKNKTKKEKEVVVKTKETKKVERKIEFPYLEELKEDELKKIKDGGYLVLDPGKKNLVFMSDQKNKYLRYTNSEKLKHTKQLKYQRLLKNHKDKENITATENKLKDYNSKTCNYIKFKEYIKNKNKINGELFDKYRNDIFRKYKWYAYINKKRTMDNMLNKIESTYGKDKPICYGSWEVSKQQRNFLPTPMIGLKRKIAERFQVYTLDEFRTSCLNHKTEEKCENLSLPDKKGNYHSIHAVLTYQMENKRYGCIQRDKNSVNNMLKLVDSWLTKKERPLKFRRNYDLNKPESPKEKKTVKSTNPSKTVSNGSKPTTKASKAKGKGAITSVHI